MTTPGHYLYARRPQDGSDQDLRVTRLADVRVESPAQSSGPILRRHIGGQRNDRHCPAAFWRQTTKLSHERVSILVRHGNVTDDDMRALLRMTFEAGNRLWDRGLPDSSGTRVGDGAHE